jgi:hypothetical protein
MFFHPSISARQNVNEKVEHVDHYFKQGIGDSGPKFFPAIIDIWFIAILVLRLSGW